MTFEEWYNITLPLIPETSYELKQSCKEVWNAAINAAMKELEKDEYYSWNSSDYSDYYICFPALLIEHLKSS